MAKTKTSFSQKILIGVSWFAALIPRRAGYVFACVLAFIWFDVIRLRRYTILRGLTIAFPNESKKWRYDMARTFLRQMCYLLPEILTLPQLTSRSIDRDVIFHGWENMQKALAQGKGVLVLSMHMGNGDISISSTALRGVIVNVISKRFKNKFFDELWFGIREQQGARFIDAHGVRSAQEILAALKKNEIVVFVIDQFIASPYGIPVPFFGKVTGTQIGLAKFATKTKAPVIPVYGYHDENLRMNVVFDPEIPIPAFEGKASDELLARLTLKYNQKAEEIIRKHPSQWMWLHRRWKKFR